MGQNTVLFPHGVTRPDVEPAGHQNPASHGAVHVGDVSCGFTP